MTPPLFATLLSAALVSLASCGPTVEPPELSYAEKYPIRVRAETVAATLPFSSAARDATDGMRFDALVSGYLDRGNGPLTVVAPSEPQALKQALMAAGIPANAIRTLIVPASAMDTVTLRYERYVASRIECGDWSGSAGHDPLNTTHSNFGCAMQNNFGAMAADPADLVRMREAAPTDAQNSNRVMRRYRAGEPPAAVQTPLQRSGAAGSTSTR